MLGITDTRLEKFPILRPRHILICRYICCSICGFVTFNISFYFVSSGFIVSMRTVIYFLLVKLINGKTLHIIKIIPNLFPCKYASSTSHQHYKTMYYCLFV